MPIYEYSCTDCGAQFEELIFSDDDGVNCEKCGSANTEKLMSCCGFKTGGGEATGGDGPQARKPEYRGKGSTSACAGCSGGNCSSCG